MRGFLATVGCCFRADGAAAVADLVVAGGCV